MLCPICKKPVPDECPAQQPGQARPAWPFCSERCRLIDLGRWLGGKYQVPVDPQPDADPDVLPPAPPDDRAT